jgi:uncharacterized repeat protein (TIGR01451 family)
MVSDGRPDPSGSGRGRYECQHPYMGLRDGCAGRAADRSAPEGEREVMGSSTRRHALRRNLATVGLAGLLVASLVVTTPTVAAAADEVYEYTFVFEHQDGTTTTISGSDTTDNTFISDAGGTDKDNPIGMTVHISCSDKFPGGWGAKQGPDPIDDAAWRVQRYDIAMYRSGNLEFSCSGGDPIPPTEPSIDIEKSTNGHDADAPPGPSAVAGDEVTWTYVVTNTGEADLSGIAVIDTIEGPVSCPETSLAVGASMTCTLSGSASVGQYANEAEVTAVGSNGLLASAFSTGAKQKVYSFTFEHLDGTTTTIQPAGPTRTTPPGWTSTSPAPTTSPADGERRTARCRASTPSGGFSRTRSSRSTEARSPDPVATHSPRTRK